MLRVKSFLSVMVLVLVPTMAVAQDEPVVPDAEGSPLLEAPTEVAVAGDAEGLGDPALLPPLTYGSTIATTARTADCASVELLQAWLREMGGLETFGRVTGSVGILVLGSLAAGLGGWLILDPQFHTADSELSTTIGVLGVGVGLLGLAAGIVTLATQMPAEERVVRFDEAAEDGMDDRELGMFEGELRAYADTARLTRPFSIAGGIGLSLGGAASLALTAAASHLTDETRIYGYAIGAGFIVGGALVAVLSLLETPYERAWRMYREGSMPDGSPALAARIEVVPFASSTGGGLAAAGAF